MKTNKPRYHISSNIHTGGVANQRSLFLDMILAKKFGHIKPMLAVVDHI